jgi:hypothetical protein
MNELLVLLILPGLICSRRPRPVHPKDPTLAYAGNIELENP